MNKNYMYQVSTLQALSMGYTRPVINVGELLKHGKTGLGTFTGVDGEMIVLEGTCYRAAADGAVVESSPATVRPSRYVVSSMLFSAPFVYICLAPD